eukprot:943176-Pleurochrysis_carterae.AAC.6
MSQSRAPPRLTTSCAGDVGARPRKSTRRATYATAWRFRGELLSLAHAHGGGGVRGDAPDFGMSGLVRLACVAGGSLPVAKGVLLFDELIRRIQRAAMRRRTRRDAPPLDVGALVRKVVVDDLKEAKCTDLVARAAVAASRADAAGRG